jgi:hypothetical protein
MTTEPTQPDVGVPEQGSGGPEALIFAANQLEESRAKLSTLFNDPSTLSRSAQEYLQSIGVKSFHPDQPQHLDDLSVTPKIDIGKRL